MLKNVEHTVIGGGKDLVCHWPRQGGIYYWGGEILVAYVESPCTYTDYSEVAHNKNGIWKRGYVRLKRSLDNGLTWNNSVKLFDNSLSVLEQREKLHLDDYINFDTGCFRYRFYDKWNGPQRDEINMKNLDSLIIMGRSWSGREYKDISGNGYYETVVYAYRSDNRGKQWEMIPTVILPDHTDNIVELANNYLVTEDGRIYAWFVGTKRIEEMKGAKNGGSDLSSPQIYASDDNGISFEFYSEIYCDITGRIFASYPHIIVLPSGRWLCTLGCWFNPRNRWTSICYSDDRGLSWSDPKNIQSWSVSPYPILLRDGRLIIIYMRRNPDPTGLYVILSDDEAKSWSKPAVLRDDTIDAGILGCIDGGYPVALQLDDERILVAYYWQHNDTDVPWYGGRKFIGGTFFDV